jgi:hypothetical protein
VAPATETEFEVGCYFGLWDAGNEQKNASELRAIFLQPKTFFRFNVDNTSETKYSANLALIRIKIIFSETQIILIWGGGVDYPYCVFTLHVATFRNVT